MTNVLLQQTKTVVLISPPPVGSETNKTTKERVAEYAAIVKDVANVFGENLKSSQQKVLLIDLFGRVNQELGNQDRLEFSDLSYDGIHYTQKGEDLLFRIIYDEHLKGKYRLLD